MIFSLNASLKKLVRWQSIKTQRFFRSAYVQRNSAVRFFSRVLYAGQLPRKQGHLPVEIVIQHIVLGFKAAVKGGSVEVCHVTQLCDGDLFQRLFH